MRLGLLRPPSTTLWVRTSDLTHISDESVTVKIHIPLQEQGQARTEKAIPCSLNLLKDSLSLSPPERRGLGMAQGSACKMCRSEQGALFRGEKISAGTQPCFQITITYFTSALAKFIKNIHISSLDSSYQCDN